MTAPAEARAPAPAAARGHVHRPLPRHVRVAVVGAGFAGVGMAVALLRAGMADVLVLERADRLGGTWRDNSYPGCACDVPSSLYSFSFAPEPGWSHVFARQQEIQDYLERTARRFGVQPHLRVGVDVLGCRWEPGAGHWVVTTSAGTLTADVVVGAAGPFAQPSVPALPGLESFAGAAFHSARWDHGHDLRGRRVAVVGTGASAVQLVPSVQRQAAGLVLFQRTAPWVLPRGDRRVTGVERAVFRHLPATQALVRGGTYWARELRVLGFSGRTGLLRLAERRALRFLGREVPDPALRAALTPHYALGCKRVLLSDDYYATLTRPGVRVVVDRITRVTPDAVVTVDDTGHESEHEVDTIVFGTGFTVTDPPFAHRVTGADGRTLAQAWAGGGMQAHLGTAVAGFPNLFLLLGPNTGLGHTSTLVMIEAQAAYVVDLLRRMEAAGVASVEAREQVQREWNDQVQDDLAGTVWNTGGCASWYLDAAGRNTTLWPTFTATYRRRLARAHLRDYRVTPVPATAGRAS